MKCTIPEISWHNREPVLSVDIFPEYKDFYRLASGGGDCHVLVWQLNIAETGAINQEVISDLTRHQRAVNCVRWSHSGNYLASGDDDSNIIIWQLKVDNIPLLEGDTGDKEVWLVYKVLRGHKEDVYDLSWSIDDRKVLSGSVDNTAIVWDISKGKLDHILSDHKGFVQGVAWDPKNQFIATVSTDRTCRIFDPSGKQVKARISKGKINSVPDDHYLKDKEVKFFHDDTFKSFFRRLAFSPDGSLLIVPSGYIEASDCKDSLNATLLFTLDNWSTPAAILPLGRQSSTVIRCCPILFELREDAPETFIKLPYRMIFAVGTDHDIILYDTQQTMPFARFQSIHYTRLTDLTWSHDGLLLIASSTDGFCTLITFESDELGVPWTKMECDEEENVDSMSGCEELVDNDENIDIKNNIESKSVDAVQEDVKKRPSFLEQWALKTPKRKRDTEKKTELVQNTSSEVIVVLDSLDRKAECGPSNIKEKEVKKTVRRIVPLKCGDVSSKTKSNNSPKNIKPPEFSTENINKPTVKRIAPKKIGEVSNSNFVISLSSPKKKADSENKKDELADGSPDIRSFFSGKSKKELTLNKESTHKVDAPLENKKSIPIQTLVKSKNIDEKKPVRRIKPQKVQEPSLQLPHENNTNIQRIKQDVTHCLDEIAVLDGKELKDYQKVSGEIQNFFCRRSSKEIQSKVPKHSEQQAFTIDDKTEDFTLQLEDSQSSCISIKESPEKQSEPNKHEQKEDEEAGCSEVKKGIGTSEKVTVPKTPKRLSLKTIASPRRKIQRIEGRDSE